jgi:hypothetical protein
VPVSERDFARTQKRLETRPKQHLAPIRRLALRILRTGYICEIEAVLADSV